jgi:DNA invertase Pin-like site-specific DNA recombinase
LTAGKEAVLKQSSEKQIKEKTAALLVQISRDDGEDGESNSIQNQKVLLTKIAKEKGYADLQVFSDDGITGTTMNRPGFKAMIREIERGNIGAVFVKDLSRLGRNYREVGYYTEDFFPDHDVRFVSVSDGIDTAEGEDEFAPFRNIMNEWYSKDISKKRRISNKVRGSLGEPLSPPPYGYLKDPENPKRWIIDEDAAAVVRKIYEMTLNGYGLGEIIRALDKDGIVTPSYYWRSKGINRGGLKAGQSPTLWQISTIQKTLSLQEYCGDIINFKTFSKSYRNKKRIENETENMAIFLDVHKPIIDRATWEKVQKMRGTRKKRPKVQQQRSIFSGFLKCADCSTNLSYHFNQRNHSIKYFNCSNNNNSRGCESTHYIREDFITEIVIKEVQRLTCFANEYEDDFVKAIIGHSMKIAESERCQKQRELDGLCLRDRELDILFGRIYEDNVTGKISDERFAKLTMMYEKEQGEISGKLKILRSELKDGNRELYTADTFLEIVRRYTNIQELSQRMVAELIDHIDVHRIEKAGEESTQRVTIYYYCIGSFTVPDWNNIPDIDIILPTRKGVAVSYSPVQMVS